MARTPPVPLLVKANGTIGRSPRFARRHGVTASAGRDAEAAVRATNVRTRIVIADKLRDTFVSLSKNGAATSAEATGPRKTTRSKWKRAHMVLDRWGEQLGGLWHVNSL